MSQLVAEEMGFGWDGILHPLHSQSVISFHSTYFVFHELICYFGQTGPAIFLVCPASWEIKSGRKGKLENKIEICMLAQLKLAIKQTVAILKAKRGYFNYKILGQSTKALY